MQWTEELNALLNQCVFECGYDFTAASALLLSRARQLRLVSADERISLTSDECQVQWMEINPVVEDDEDGYDAAGLHDNDDENDLFLRRSASAIAENDLFFYQLHNEEAPLTSAHQRAVGADHDEIRPVQLVDGRDDDISSRTGAAAAVEVPPGCPKLELSLSDADLDALLNSLPTSEATSDSAAADAKKQMADTTSSSEMQWVLSFLTDPDAVAHQDAEAKNLLFENTDKAEDDNYQYFLQELGHANLLSPQKPDTSAQLKTDAGSATQLAASSDESSDDGSDGDWMETRKNIKTSGPSRSEFTAAATHHKRRLLSRTSHLDVDLPPAAPVRFPPRSIQQEAVVDEQASEGDDSDDNGLDALPRYSPPEPTVASLRAPLRDLRLAPPVNSAKRLALSQEIGQQLRKHGEFQFPKRLFRDAETEPTGEQAPEAEGDAP